MIMYMLIHNNYTISNFTKTFSCQNMNKLPYDGMKNWKEDNYFISEYTKHNKLGIHIDVNDSRKLSI